MSYTNVSDASTKPAELYVDHHWVHSEQTNFFKKHILARGAYLILGPASLITSAVDTIIGLGVGIGVVCTLGKHKQTFNFAYIHLSSSNKLLLRPYRNILKAINPKAEFTTDLRKGILSRYLGGEYKPPMISSAGDGFVSDMVIKSLENLPGACFDSDNFLKRHVASRLAYALLAVSLLVTRVVDGIIGIPAGGLSILTGGRFESLNNLAYRTLQAPCIIGNLFYLTVKFINPGAEL